MALREILNARGSGMFLDVRERLLHGADDDQLSFEVGLGYVGLQIESHVHFCSLGKHLGKCLENFQQWLVPNAVDAKRAHRGAQLIQPLLDLPARALHHANGAAGLWRDEARGSFQENRGDRQPVSDGIVHLPGQCGPAPR